jgi:hypothetical protein
MGKLMGMLANSIKLVFLLVFCATAMVCVNKITPHTAMPSPKDAISEFFSKISVILLNIGISSLHIGTV